MVFTRLLKSTCGKTQLNILQLNLLKLLNYFLSTFGMLVLCLSFLLQIWGRQSRPQFTHRVIDPVVNTSNYFYKSKYFASSPRDTESDFGPRYAVTTRHMHWHWHWMKTLHYMNEGVSIFYCHRYLDIYISISGGGVTRQTRCLPGTWMWQNWSADEGRGPSIKLNLSIYWIQEGLK